jgi:hypothetical protein
MGIRILALGALCVAGLWGQHRRFSWQNYSNTFCISPSVRPWLAPSRESRSRARGEFPSPVKSNPASASASGSAKRQSMPFASTPAGSCFNNPASPVCKGREYAVKRTPRAKNGRTTGTAGANPDLSTGVDQAVRRLSINSPPAYLTRAAWELQGSGEFWVVGKAGLAGSEAVAAGMKDFSMAVSIGSKLASDVAFEFEKEPAASAVQTWKTTLGVATLEDGVLHVRLSMEPDEAKEKFGGIVASMLGRHLAGLVKAAQYLPVRDPNAAKKPGPVINGLN